MASTTIKIKLADLLKVISATPPKKKDEATVKRAPGTQTHLDDAEFDAIREYLRSVHPDGGLDLGSLPSFSGDAALLYRLDLLIEKGVRT